MHENLHVKVTPVKPGEVVDEKAGEVVVVGEGDHKLRCVLTTHEPCVPARAARLDRWAAFSQGAWAGVAGTVAAIGVWSDVVGRAGVHAAVDASWHDTTWWSWGLYAVAIAFVGVTVRHFWRATH